jgi:hypothetical protein
MSGKWVVALIFGLAAAMSGVLIYIHSDRDFYRGQALEGIQKKFEEKKGEILAIPEVIVASGPAGDFSIFFSQMWSFRFEGDELWVGIPFKAPEVSESLAIARDEALAAWFRGWLHKQASDMKRFPIRIRWQ